MAKKKQNVLTVGEFVEMISKYNWNNEIYICDEAKSDYMASAEDNRDSGMYLKILGISSHSGGIVTLNFDLSETSG